MKQVLSSEPVTGDPELRYTPSGAALQVAHEFNDECLY
jgi:hypothetical protein